MAEKSPRPEAEKYTAEEEEEEEEEEEDGEEAAEAPVRAVKEKDKKEEEKEESAAPESPPEEDTTSPAEAPAFPHVVPVYPSVSSAFYTPEAAAAAAAAYCSSSPLNLFANDGSFMEMFKKKMEATGSKEEAKEPEEKKPEPDKRKPISFVGKRRGGAKLALKTGIVAKKLKTDEEEIMSDNMSDTDLQIVESDIPLDAESEGTLPTQMQDIVDQSVSRSFQTALQSTLASLQKSIAKSMAIAMSQAAGPTPLEGLTTHLASGLHGPGKSTRKRHHTVDTPDSPVGECLNTHSAPSKSGILYPSLPKIRPTAPEEAVDKRARPTFPEEVTTKQIVHSKPVSSKESSMVSVDTDVDESDTSDEENMAQGGEAFAPLDDSAKSDTSDEENMAEGGEASAPLGDSAKLEAQSVTFFSPDQIINPLSGDWTPIPQVANFVASTMRKSIDKGDLNKLRAECPRPVLPSKAALTPEIDPLITKYLVTIKKNPRNGIDRSFRCVQHKLLDILGPLTKIVNLSEEAAATGQPLDAKVIRGWAQRAMCMLGNTNVALSSERRRSILMLVDRRLSHLATNEPGPSAEGLLFGDGFLKDIDNFFDLCNTLDKAKSTKPVFGRAGRSRGRFPSRTKQARQPSRGPPISEEMIQYPPSLCQESQFFPSIGRPWRSRGQRGFSKSRPFTDYVT